MGFGDIGRISGIERYIVIRIFFSDFNTLSVAVLISGESSCADLDPQVPLSSLMPEEKRFSLSLA